MANSYNPEVTAILETLRKLGPPQTQQQSHFQPHAPHSLIAPIATPQPHALPTASQSIGVPDIDANGIIAWPPALRHVLKSIATNEQILASIRKLITAQHNHEREWRAGRDALIQRLAERPSGRAKLESILLSVNPSLQSSTKLETTKSDKEKDRQELVEFDKKVYRAQTEMVAAMSKELEKIGVPFFGTRRELIMQEMDEICGQVDGYNGNEFRKAKEKGKIGERELLVLQRRMLETLEDLAIE